MTTKPLSFAALEEQIKAMPDGPAAILATPRWLAPFTVLGTAGLIVGILPFLLIQLIAPQIWMLWVAWLRLGMALMGYGPSVIRSVWVLTEEFWNWKPRLVEQSDHDLGQFKELRQWLRKFPHVELEDHLRFAVLAQQRLSLKLGVLQGGFDKLGVLPALLALFFLIRNANDLSIDALLRVPQWQSWTALIFAITYLIGFLAMLMRVRLHLYEVVLADALDIR